MTCFRPKAQFINAAVGAGAKSPAAEAAGESCCRSGGWCVLYIRIPGGGKPRKTVRATHSAILKKTKTLLLS